MSVGNRRRKRQRDRRKHGEVRGARGDAAATWRNLSRSDLALVRKAVRQDWPTAAAVKSLIVDGVFGAVRETDAELVLAGARTAIDLDRANIRHVAASLALVAVGHGMLRDIERAAEASEAFQATTIEAPTAPVGPPTIVVIGDDWAKPSPVEHDPEFESFVADREAAAGRAGSTAGLISHTRTRTAQGGTQKNQRKAEHSEVSNR